MKTLSLAHPVILTVVGLPGAGKSFFARQFAETFAVACVSLDRLRSELFADPTYSQEESAIVGRLQEYMVGELTKTKRSFLIDGGCDTRAARQQIEKLAKDNGYVTLTIWVQTDPTTARQRSLKRNPNKKDDAHNKSLDPVQFESFSKRFAQPTRETYVVISGKHTYAAQAKMVLRKLAAPHAHEAERAHQKETRQIPDPRPNIAPKSRGFLIR